MRVFDERSLLEDIWGVTVSIILSRLTEICGKDRLIFEIEHMKNIEKLAREEFDKLLNIFGDNCPRHFSKSRIREYLRNIGIVPNSYYSEYLALSDLAIALDIGIDEGEIVTDVYLTKEKCNNEYSEIREGLYIHEGKENVECNVRDCMFSFGTDIRDVYYDQNGDVIENIEEYEGEVLEENESEVVNGYICSFTGDYEFLFEVQEKTNNKKLKKMIDYFLMCLVNMEHPNVDVVICKEEFDFKIYYFESSINTISEEEMCIMALMSSVKIMIFAEKLLEELKKEGYLV